jgi:hypothetical protein
MSIRNRERRKSFFTRSSSSYSSGPTTSILVLTLLAGGFVLISPTSMIAALAQEGHNTTLTATTGNNSTTTATSVSEIELSPQPIYQERARTLSETPINQIHMSITFSGNGMLTLPTTPQRLSIPLATVVHLSHLQHNLLKEQKPL